MKTRLIGFFIFLAVLLAMVIAVNGASIPGTIVAAAITTGDTANDFATAFTFEIQGTMKQVPDLTARDAISADRRTEGMFCYVTGETNLYTLVGGTNNANWMLWASPTNANVTLVTVNNFVETNIFSSFTATNIYATNIFASNIVTVYLVSSNAYFTNVWIQTLTSITNFLDTVYITNKLELEYLTPSTVLQADANRDIASIPNGTGALTNDNAGHFGWFNGFGSGSGSVTSVGLQTTGTGLGVSGTPVTGSGVLSLDSPSAVLTNEESAITVFSNHVKIDVKHALFPSNATPSTVAYIGADNTLTNVGTGQIPITDLASSSVTVNGTANHVTTTSASIALGGSATLDVGTSVVLRDANNVWVNTSSNFNNNAVWTDATNANNTTPDFAISTSTLSTNASFTWLLPTHLDGSGKVEQWIKTSVTNSSGTLITMTAPAGCHVCGAGANNVTNWTEILWQYYPPSGPTNYWPIPGY